MNVAQDGIFLPDVDYYVYRKCTPAWKMHFQQIDFNDLTYLIDGEAEYIINGVGYHACAGDLICMPKGSTREAVTPQNNLMQCYCVNFRLHDFDGNDTALPFPTLCHIGLQQDIIRLYKDLNTEWLCRSPGHRIKTTGLLLLIIQRYMELIVYDMNSEVMDIRIKKVIRYMANHYDENLRIQQFADQFDLSAMYFGLLFKRTVGTSFHQYLMEIRLKNAETMLRSGEYNVGEAALSCGFRDAFYFSKAFKNSRHISPSKIIGERWTPSSIQTS